jgi:hypothetical protein
MAYEKKNFKDGVVLSAEHLNHMEKGIEDAHNMIGTADISGIGDGTVKGAILALKAMIESGGGSSGGESSEGFNVEFFSRSSYGESTEIDLYENPAGLWVDPIVPDKAQMHRCYVEAYYGETYIKCYAPDIVDYSGYYGCFAYGIYFGMGSLDEESHSYNMTIDAPHLIAISGNDHFPDGLYVNFDAFEQTYSNVFESSCEIDTGNIVCPQVYINDTRTSYKSHDLSKYFTQAEYGNRPCIFCGNGGN